MRTRSRREQRALHAKAATRRQEPGRVPGWTVPLAPSSAGRNARSLLRQRFPAWGKQEHEAAAGRFTSAADRLQAAWGERWDRAFEATHGRLPGVEDYRVSGIGSQTLPEPDQDVLRGLAHATTRAKNLADGHRAAGRHLRRRTP
jgi:hypothetical protein